MIKHTPGPWEIRKQDIYGSDGQFICQWSGTIKDAHLIASAPELLEVLKMYIAFCGNTGYSVTREQFKRLYDDGIKAITKAEGK